MGFVGNLLGLNGNNGANFQAQGGVSPQQLSNLSAQVNGGFNQQQSFLNALAAQNGIGNQSSVFNQQQGLADTLSQQAQGGGPNPAQAQLAQTTGQNINNQAALMAGARGINNNPGLLAQQIGQQGANIQQQAGGQAATLRAQQMLAAQQTLQQQQAMMGSLANTQVGQQGNTINSLNQGILQNQGQVFGLQGNMNDANAGIAKQNASTQGSMLQGVGSTLGTAGLGLVGLNQGGQVGPTSKLAQFVLSKGGKVPAMVSPGERYIPKGEVDKIKSGQKTGAYAGKVIPGKAKVDGDSQKNDTVKKKLEPGGVVVPRTKSKDPKKTEAFINAILGMQRAA